MHDGEDLEYFRQRVIIERQRAVTAPSKKIADVHMQLADLYESYVESFGNNAPDVWPKSK